MAFSADSFSLAGKVAIVTGAGGRPNGIGRAYALGLAALGATVLVADLDGDGAGDVASEITNTGGRATGLRVDISDPASVANMAAAAADSYGGVDILVNNAALMAELSYEPVISTSLQVWRKVLDVNLTGALNCAQAVAPMMRARGGGRIVNQLSGGAFPPTTLYGISKIALLGLTTTLARELGPDRITVNAIAPGAVRSAAGQSLTPPESPFRKMLESQVALRPEGEPDDLVGALVLLCSAAGAWITGQVIHVDGGWIIRP